MTNIFTRHRVLGDIIQYLDNSKATGIYLREYKTAEKKVV